MGGTGASTGLMPAFTLGCGTWGGSATSENVTPLHLVNIKKVAYGLVDCETLAANDPTFSLNRSASACQTAAPVGVGGGCCTGPGAFSPAQYAAMGAALNNNPSCCSGTKDDGLNQDDLMALVNQLVSAMKGAN